MATRNTSHPLWFPGFLRVLLGIWAMLAQKPFLHNTIMRHDVGCRWDDVLYGPLEVCADGFGEECVVGCHSFQEIFGEEIPIFFELVLPLLLSGLIEQLLLPLPLFFILWRLGECWWCEVQCWWGCILRLATSSSSSMYEMFSAIKRCFGDWPNDARLLLCKQSLRRLLRKRVHDCCLRMKMPSAMKILSVGEWEENSYHWSINC